MTMQDIRKSNSSLIPLSYFMTLQPSTTSFTTQPYLHFPSLKSNTDGRTSIHSLEKSHLSKNDVIRLVMDKEKPVFPVKAKFESGRPLNGINPPIPPSTIVKRKRELVVDERGVEEEVARNVSKILSATRAAQNAFPPPPSPSTVKNTLTTPIDPSWITLKSTSPSPKLIQCHTCSKCFPSPKSLRSHSCIVSTEGISPTTTLNAPLNLSQLLQSPSAPVERNVFDSTEIPSNLITPDVSSYESSPPSESSMDEWNGVREESKKEETDKPPISPISNTIKTISESKWCPDCRKTLSSTTNMKRHRSMCRPSNDIKEEPSTPIDTPLPKWAENKSQSWLQLSVGEHLKAKHLGFPLNLKNEVKEENELMRSLPPSVAPPVAHPVKEDTVKTPSLIRVEKDKTVDNRGPFECSVCYKTFSCRKNVRRHMVAIHKVIPPPGAPLTLTQSINGHTTRITMSCSSEDSLDGDEKYEEDGVEVKIEETGEDSFVPPSPVSQGGQSSPVKTKMENGLEKEKEKLIGEKRRIIKVERETPLDFTLQSANKRSRIEVLREEDRAVIIAQSVRVTVSRVGAMRASPLLASLLSNTREISLDVCPTALQSMLMVYSDNSKLSLDNIVSVAEISLKLKVNQVKNACEKYIMTELPKLTLMKAIRLADMYKMGKMKDQLFSSLTIESLRTMSYNDDYQGMPPQLKSELLDKFGEFL